MYVTRAERVLAHHRWQLREAQVALASARAGNDPGHTAACEEHVTRMLSFTWNAQLVVHREQQARAKRVWLTAAVHDQGGMDIIGFAT